MEGREAVEAVFDELDPDGAPPLGGLPNRAIALRRADGTIGACGVEWRSRFAALPRLALREAIVGPVRAHAEHARGDLVAEATILRSALRELAFGDRVWHMITLRLDAGREPLVTVAVEYAAIHRLPVSVTYHPANDWTDQIPRPGVPCELRVLIYDSSVKGRLAKRLGGSGYPIPSCNPTDTVGRDRAVDSDMYYFALDITEGVSDSIRSRVAPEVSDVVFREATEEEMYPGLFTFGENLGLVERSLRAGDRCVVGLLDGRIVFHMWASENQRFLRSLYPAEVLTRRSAHGYGSHTAPELRKKGVYIAALCWFIDEARSRGVEQIVGQAAAWNDGAVKAVERLGFQRIQVGASVALDLNP